MLNFLGQILILVVFINIEKGSINLRATKDFTIYKNSNLGLANYGDTYEYVNPEVNKHVTGADLSSKSELQLSFKFGVSGQNSYIAVGGYGIYVSTGTTIRLLYLDYESSTGKDKGYMKKRI